MTARMTNNAESALLFDVAVGATALQLAAGDGDLFPVLEQGQWFPLYLIQKPVTDAQGTLISGGDYEIVRVTERVGDILTIERNREGTTALAFSAEDVVSLRLTEAAWNTLLQSGVANLTVLKGINFGVATGSGSAMAVTIGEIPEYSANLEINITPPAVNAGAATINVNALGAKSIKLPGGGALPAGVLPAKRVSTLRFDSVNDQFIVQNPATVSTPATALVAGVVKKGTAEDFNVDGNDDSFTTQKTVSRIIQSSQGSSVFSPQWSNFGRGLRGNVDINTAQTLFSGRSYEYERLSVGAGGSITVGSDPAGGITVKGGQGMLVIRARERITINGTLIFAQMNSALGQGFVGPRGSVGVTPADTEPEIINAEPPLYGGQAYGGALKLSVFDMAVMSDTPFAAFHGGHGRGYVYAGSAFAHFGGGHIILIAPEVTISADAVIDMHGYGSLDAAAGDGAGGMLIASCNELTLGQAASYIVGAPGTQRTAAQLLAETNAGTHDLESAHGQFFSIDLDNAGTTRHF